MSLPCLERKGYRIEEGDIAFPWLPTQRRV